MARRIGCCYAVCVLMCVFIVPPSYSDTFEDVEAKYDVAGIGREYITTLSSNVKPHYLRLRRQASSGGNETTAPNTVTTQQPVPTAEQPAQSTAAPAQPTTAASTPTLAPNANKTTTPTTKAPTQAPAATTTPPPGSGIGTESNTLPPIIKEDNHNYYRSRILPESSSEYFVELDQPTKHDTLSSGHRVAVTINLPFSFRFYGHNITNVTVATGGFIYMSPFLHQWLTATQYIAPLMANFDTSVGDDSNIFYKAVRDEFIIEWHDVILKDQATSGSFIFQAKLRNDGTITFVYKQLPLPVANISSQNHPVKIGLSDAFYNDTFLPEYGLKRRTIIEYHRVAFPASQVEQGTVIVLDPMPTCNIMGDCETCATHVNVKFECKWCDKVQRCSDGLDWYRQEWEQKGCPAEGTNPKNCRSKSETPVAVIVVVVLIVLALLGAVGVWAFYAYTHPTSASGIWLMEHRPSAMKAKIANIKFWKSSTSAGTKYQVESQA